MGRRYDQGEEDDDVHVARVAGSHIVNVHAILVTLIPIPMSSVVNQDLVNLSGGMKMNPNDFQSVVWHLHQLFTKSTF